MSELGRLTAHYFGVLLKDAGKSASVGDMHAEIEGAATEDREALEARIIALERRVELLERLSPEAK